MKLRYFIGLLGVVFAVTSCSNRENYREVVSSWTDEPLRQLIAAWGLPDRTTRLPTGQIVVEYRDKNILQVYEPINPVSRSTRRSGYQTGRADSRFTGLEAAGPARPVSILQPQTGGAEESRYYLATSCRTTFITDNNEVIRGWEFTGDNCISMPPPNSELPANIGSCRVRQGDAETTFVTTRSDCRRIGGTVLRS